MNITTAVFGCPANEIDTGGVVLHKEYVFHCGSPSSSSLRVHATRKRAWTEGEAVATRVVPLEQSPLFYRQLLRASVAETITSTQELIAASQQAIARQKKQEQDA